MDVGVRLIASPKWCCALLRWREKGAAFLFSLLAGCQSFPYSPGQIVYIDTYKIEVVTSEEAWARCRHIHWTAVSCAYIENDQMIPPGYTCLVIVAPSMAFLKHELRHCREGAFHA